MARSDNWYDGWIYEKFIAKHVDGYADTILSLIDENSGVLDVGCGTGHMSMLLSHKCRSVTGIDLSPKNIKIAQSKVGTESSHVSFVAGDLARYAESATQKFDYAIFSFVIHEVPLDYRNELINAAKKLADKIIFADYPSPMPSGISGWFNTLVEFAAGKEHYAGFKSYISNGGLKFIIDTAGLKIRKEIKDNKSINHIVLAS